MSKPSERRKTKGKAPVAAKKKNHRRMLFAVRARNGDKTDLALEQKLQRISKAAQCSEAQIIRDAVSTYLEVLERKLEVEPGSMARISASSELATA